MNVLADILAQIIEVDLCWRGVFGVDGPKLRQEYIEGRPAEGKTRGRSMFSHTNNFGEHFHVGEWDVVQKILPHLASPPCEVRVVVREKKVKEGIKGFGELRKLLAI